MISFIKLVLPLFSIVLLVAFLAIFLPFIAGDKGDMKQITENKLDRTSDSLRDHKEKTDTECDDYLVLPDDHISMIQLIASPEKYENKLVQISGYCINEPEGPVLFLSEEFANQLLYENSIFIRLQKDASFFSDLNKQWIMIEGRYEQDNRGPQGLFSGTLTNIQRVMHQPSRHQIEEGRISAQKQMKEWENLLQQDSEPASKK